MQKIHYLLGYSGLIPFIGLSISHVLGWPMAQFALITYSTLIISFLAGTLWSASLHYSLNWQVAFQSNVMMLIAWGILLLHDATFSLVCAAALLIIQLWYENRKLKPFYPVQLLKMRVILTMTASSSMILASVFN